MYFLIAKAQGRGPLTVNYNRTLQLLEGGGAHMAVVAQLLDVKQTAVGSEADLPQGG